MIAITLAEIYYGIEKSPVKKKERRLKIEHIKSELDIYPFNEQAAVKYGAIRAALEKIGKPISERDTQIASIALVHKLCIVTQTPKNSAAFPSSRLKTGHQSKLQSINCSSSD